LIGITSVQSAATATKGSRDMVLRKQKRRPSAFEPRGGVF
jgi:hypothetical protein